jgi:predicted dehydrogenase
MRLGLAGLGVGAFYLESFKNCPEVLLTSVCDLDGSKWEPFAKDFPEACFVSKVEEMIVSSEVDAIFLATYDDDHGSQVIKALENDKHVFVEKPLCLEEKELRRIREILRGNPKLLLSSNLLLRRAPRFRWLKERIDSGDFGRLYNLQGAYHYGRFEKITKGWRGRRKRYSVMHGGGVHLVDLLCHFEKSPVREIFAFGNRLCGGGRFDFDDCVLGLLKFESGALARIEANFACVKPHFHALEVFGEQATFINREDFAEFFVSRDPEKRAEKIYLSVTGLKKNILVDNFLQVLLRREKLIVTAEEVLRVMEICFALERSARSGEKVILNS